jgi:hypothetical protein
MHKGISVFLLVLLFTFALPANATVNASENTPTSKAISLDITYNSWETAKGVGEYYYYSADFYQGYLKFKCAYRIGETKKFKVTYVSEY